jgi:hypothetical protein
MLARHKRPLYRRWQHLYYATTTSTCNNWFCYGAVGLKMYKPWAVPKIGFDLFEDWVYSNLGQPPRGKYTLALIDRRKDVRPGNLCWETRQWVTNHRRDNYVITMLGRKQSLADWCRETGIPKGTAWSRIHDMGMTPRKAFNL